MHTEKFWRENAKFVEANDFKMLKVLISLLKSDDEVKLSRESSFSPFIFFADYHLHCSV